MKKTDKIGESITLDFSKSDGIIPVIVQDHRTGDVLMLAYTNKEAFEKTLATGNVWLYSRSRNKLWMKGETSGNVQKVKDIYVDCDNDTLLIKAEQIGKAACHEGYESCFFRDIKGKVVDKKVFDPKTV